MKICISHLYYAGLVLCLGTAINISSTALAVVAPSTYTTAIQVQGEAEGTEFDDWASAGIPVASTDPLDNPGSIDINQIQIANDDDFIYIRVTYHNTNSAGTFLGFDVDQDSATGFDIFTLGEIGVELGYSNDFPFEQGTGVFNTGDPLTGGPIGNGGALLWPFFDINGAEKEYAIPLDAAFTNPAEAVFSGSAFDFIVYTDAGLADVSEVITYTLASNPGVPEDLNGDGFVDGLDLGILLGNWNTETTAENGELNGTPPVDGLDLGILLGAWNPPPSSATAAVPEPSTALGLSMALLLLSMKRYNK